MFLVRELSRYLYGVSGIEQYNSEIYSHTKRAFQLMEDKFYIGDLYTPELDQDWILRTRGDNRVAFSNDLWAIEMRETLSNTTFVYRFQNPNYQIKLNSKGSGWIGRHWILNNGTKSRIYTNCSALDTSIEIYRKSLWGYLNDQNFKIEEIPDYPVNTQYLTLTIKAYNAKGALSNELKKDTNSFDNDKLSQENVKLNFY